MSISDLPLGLYVGMHFLWTSETALFLAVLTYTKQKSVASISNTEHGNTTEDLEGITRRSSRYLQEEWKGIERSS